MTQPMETGDVVRQIADQYEEANQAAADETATRTADERAAWRDAVAAALPEHAYTHIVHNNWKATWSTARGVWAIDHGPNRSREIVATITGPGSRTELTKAPAEAVIAILRALGAIAPDASQVTAISLAVADIALVKPTSKRARSGKGLS